jgi:hypothetical protein
MLQREQICENSKSGRDTFSYFGLVRVKKSTSDFAATLVYIFEYLFKLVSGFALACEKSHEFLIENIFRRKCSLSKIFFVETHFCEKNFDQKICIQKLSWYRLLG